MWSRRVFRVAAALIIVMCTAAVARTASATSLEDNERLAVQAFESTQVIEAPRAARADPNTAAAIPSGCVTNPFPTQPNGPSWSVEVANTVYTGASRFTLTGWRQACINDPTRSAIFIRYIPPASQSIFVCGGGASLDAIQNGASFSLVESSRYTATPSSPNSFCGTIYTATTFLVDQRPGRNFNDQAEVTFRYGRDNANRLTVPDWTPNVPLRTLTLRLVGDFMGQVTSSPSGIICTAGSCTADFYQGTTVTLTAGPWGTSVFRGWSGGCGTGTAATIRFVVAADTTCEARFTAPPVDPETGWWWSASEPGRGYSLELKNGRLFIASYAYRPDGSPVWYTTSGAWDGNSLTAPLTEFSGGQTLAGEWRPADDAGDLTTVTLSFSSPTRGTLAWANGQRTSIQRYSFAADAIKVASPPFPAAEIAVSEPPDAPVADARMALAAKVADRGRMRVIVRMKKIQASSANRKDGVQKMPIASSLAASDSRVQDVMATQPLMLVSVTPAGLAALEADPDVETVHEDRLDRLMLSVSGPRIGADRARAVGAAGSGTTIAILDSGVEASNSFFGGRVVEEACFSTQDPDYFATSNCPGGGEAAYGPGTAAPCTSAPTECRHGTHVAGIAAGAGSGMYGVAPSARVLAINVFTTFSSYSLCGAARCIASFAYDQLRALEYVLARASQLNIVSANMSLGGGGYTSYCDSDPLKDVIDRLRSANVATVIASGNNGYISSVSSPACISSAIRVGATSSLGAASVPDIVASFTNQWSRPMLMAPGVQIRSSVPGGGFVAMNGTSMAAPQVAGAWAAIRSLRGDASVTDVNQMLTTTARTVNSYNAYPRIEIGALAERLAAIETGWWWNASEPGRGFFIEIQNGSLFLSAFLYGPDGRSAWYTAMGAYSQGTFESNVIQYAGGQAIGAAWRQATAAADYGRITLRPTASGQILATLPSGKQLTLVRFAF